MLIYLAADHRGFKLKGEIEDWLRDERYRVIDLGNDHYDPRDDYPDFAQKLVVMMKKDEGASRGILFCGSGMGVDIAANRFSGIRCGLGFNTEQVRSGRRDDNINCLSIAADYSSLREAKALIGAFLMTKFDGREDHQRRLEKIERT